MVCAVRTDRWTRISSKNSNRKVEEAIAEIIVKMGLEKLPLWPPHDAPDGAGGGNGLGTGWRESTTG